MNIRRTDGFSTSNKISEFIVRYVLDTPVHRVYPPPPQKSFSSTELRSGNSFFGFFTRTTSAVAGLVLLLLLIVVAPPGAVAQDNPTVSITNVTVTEGAEAIFNVTREGELSGDTESLTVYFSTKDGSAKAGEDYNSKQGTLTFSGNSRDLTIRVQTIKGSETYYELQETFKVELRLGDSSGDRLAEATGRIDESGTRPTLTVNRSIDVNEGEIAKLTLELSGELDKSIEISFFFEKHQIVTSDDYEAPSNTTLMIPRGSLTGSVTIQTTDDDIAEPDEEILINFRPSNPYRLSIQSPVITIKDNDDDKGMPLVYLAGKTSENSDLKTRIDIEEGQTGIIEVMLTSPAPAGGVNIPLKATVGPPGEGTASDFTMPSSITIPVGEKSASTTFTVIDDKDNERFREGLLIEIGDMLSGVSKGDRSELEVFMRDNDRNSIELKNLSPESVKEGKSATFELHLTRALKGRPSSVPFGNVGEFYEQHIPSITLEYSGTATEESDFKAEDNCSSLTQKCTGTIKTIDNGLYERNKEVKISLGFNIDPGGLVINQKGGPLTLTIEEDDEKPSFSIEDKKAAEGGEISFTVKRGGALENEVSVKVATANDSTEGAHQAVAGTDYTAKTMKLEFDPNDEEKSFKVQTTHDTTDENDETFLVKLSESMPADETEISDGTATGTIEDNDDPPTVSVSNAEAVTEGNDSSATKNMTFTVSLSAASGKNITVPYVLSGSAMSEDDYIAPAQPSVSIAAGAISGTITIPIRGDILHETNETVVVTLSEPVNATLSSAKVATGTITDDDAAPTAMTITVDADTGTNNVQDSIVEDGGVKKVRVTAAIIGATRFATDKTVTIVVGKAADSATSGTDYTAVTNKSITITSGAASGYVEFDVTPTPDMLKEEIETISVEGTLTGVTFSQTAIKLTDSDAAPAVTITLDADTGENGIQNSIDESDTSGKTVRVTATLEGTTRFPGSKAVTITVGKAGDTATEGTDYATVADQTITIPANTASASVDFTLTPRQDMLDDDNESISVEGSATGVGTVTHASITITDDDAAPNAIKLTVDTNLTANNDQDSLVEDGGAKTVRVTATITSTTRFATDQTVAIVVGKAADSATSGTDYTAVTNKSITITSGAASGYVEFTLTPTPDMLKEEIETISVEGTLTGVTFSQTAIKLTDSDAAPAVTITLDADTGENGIQNSIDESDTSGKTVRVTATLEGTTRFPGSKAVTITVGKAGDTATEGTDYATVADQTITIPANTASASVDFTLTPRQDMLDDDNESISVEGSATGVGTVTHASITITDDDSAPTSMTITVDADTAVNNDQDSLVEDGGAKTVRVTATLGGSSRFPTNKTVTIVVGKAADSATEGTDYATVTNKSITITSGAASGYVDFTLTPTPDTLVEGEESISIEGSLAGITSVTNTAIKLTDSDAAPAVTITLDADTGENGIQNSIDESDTSGKTVRVTATLEGTTRFPGSKAVTITVGKAGDTATEGTDYATVADQTITIPANTASASVDFTLTPRQDMLDDDNESISVEGSATGVGTVTHASITITDDDSAPTSMTITVDADTAVNNDQDSLVEDGGAKTVRVTATLGGSSRFPTNKTVTIVVGKAADSATEGTDYATVTNKSITITSGAASGYVDFTLTPTPDTLVEGEESISIEGSLAGITSVTNTAIKLTDSDAAPAVTITLDADTGENGIQNSIDESDTSGKTVRVTATLEGTTRFPGSKAVTITVGKAGDTATEGTDYATVADQTITIPANTASASVDFTLTPRQDMLDDDNESISVEGSATGVGTVTHASITITDDDAAPNAIKLTVDTNLTANNDQDSLVEDGGAKTVRVTATITSTTRFATDQTVAIVVGKAADSATSGTDYTAVTNKSITITSGAASGYVEFTLTPTPDMLKEEIETISVEGTLTGVTFSQTAIKLTDSDAAPAVTITLDADTGENGIQNSIDESDTSGKTVRVTATLEGTTRFPGSKAVTITVGKAGDTATEGTDYATVADQTITIPANTASASVDFTLTPRQDMLDDDNESISVEGSATGVGTVTHASITITDDDAAPNAIKLTVDTNLTANNDQDSLVEDGGAKTVRVTATITSTTRFATDQTVAIVVGKAADSATSGTDYTAVTNKSITITSGAASGYVEFTLTPTPDMLKEEIETISVEGTLTGVTFSQTAIKLTDSDAAPAVTITLDADTGENGIQNSIDESDTSGKTVRVTATLEGTTRFPGSKAVTITVGKAGDTATEGTDYATVADQTITIPANTASASVDFTLTPRQDMLDDDNESISVEGSATGVGTVTHASITITDDDSAPTSMTITVDADTAVNNDQDSLVEDGGAKTVRVTATLGGSSRFPTNKTVTIVVGKAADSATEGTDYATVTNKSITITSGAASGYVDFTLTPTPDTLVEGEESISIEGSLAGITSVTNTAIKLTDSDAAPAVTITLDADTGENGIQNSIDESDTSGKTVRVTATLEGTTRFPGSKAVTITVGKAGDTATEGTDYATVADQTITIPANTASASVDFTLTPRQDMLDDDNESISVEGSATGVGTVTHASITITDDDSAPTSMTITVDADTAVNNDQDSLVEDGGAKTVRVTATLGGSSRFPTNKTVTIVVGKAADSATEGTDYATVTNKSITITSGAASGYVDFTLTPTPDTLVEGEESISIEGSLAGITSVTNTAIKLTDSDAAPAVTITLDADTGENGIQNSIDESDTSGKTVRVTATLEGTTRFPGSKAVTITVGKAGDTATEGTDYATVADQTITIPANTASASVDFTLTPRQDMLDDDNESISVEGSATGVGTVTHASITITDDDAAPNAIKLTVDTNLTANNDQDSLVEDGGAKTVRVTATITSTTRFATDQTVAIVVGKAADSATSGTDYTAVTNKSITITSGAASGYVEFTLTPTPDMLKEEIETISVEGTLTGVTFSQTAIKLTDSDAAPAVTITLDADTGENGIQNSIDESDTSGKTVRVTATLEGTTRFPGSKAVTITVGKAGDTATEGTDYATVADQTITIPANTASASVDFTLTPRQDMLDDDNESISVEGSATGVGTVTHASITITDDDAAPNAIKLTVDTNLTANNDQDSLVEDGGAKTVRVTATITSTTRFATDQTVAIVVGKAADSATSGTDYTAVTNKSITITSGAASGYVEFTLTPTPDMLKEEIETISVEGTLTGVTFSQTAIKLTDSDAAPAVTITLDADTGENGIQNSIDESDTSGKTVRVTATLEGTTRFPGSKAVTITVGKAGDTATEGTDYATVADQTITIPANTASASVDFTLTPRQDMLDDDNESISVEGSATGVGTVTHASITITDDDSAPTSMTITVDADTAVNNDQDSLVEDGGAKTVRVTATLGGSSRFPTNKTVTIVVGKAADSATEGTDYATVTNKSITITSGAASGYVDFTLTPTPDTLVEGEESISIEGSLAGITSVTNTAIKLTDSDAAPAVTITLDADTGENGIQNSIDESDTSGKTVRVTATLEGTTRFPGSKAVTITVGKAGDTATEGTDYATVADQTITIPANTASASVDFTLTPRQDMLDDDNESISVEGSATGVGTVTHASITITDDDSAPTSMTITVDADTAVNNDQDSLVEDGGAKTVRVTATLGGSSRFPTNKTVTIVVGKAADSATEGTDYATVTNKSITITSGAASGYVDFTLTPTPDTLVEGEESISIEGSLAGITSVTNTAIKLTDSDAAPAVTITLDADTGENGIQNSIDESDTSGKTVRVTATLEGTTRFPGSKAVTITVGKAGDTATEGTDYATVADQTITIPANTASASVDFTLTPRQDMLDDDNESISVEGSATGVGTVTHASITITDDDAAPNAIKLTVDTNLTANNDQDSLVEDGGAKTVRVTATITSTTRFATDQTVAIVVGKAADSATSGTDYTAVTNKSITITSGAASGYVEFDVTPTPDMLKEEIETISVEGTLTGVTFSQTAIKLTDSDAAPAVTITLDADTGENGIQNSIDESDTSGKTVRVTATLEGTTRFPGSKAVTITVGKAGDTATEGTDYATVADQTITIPANTASASVDFTLTPRQDMLDDDNESISVEGSATGVGTVTHASITITDDDAAPNAIKLTVDTNLTANNDQDSLVEDGGAKTVRVTATITSTTRFATDQTVAIVVGKAADSATSGTDYTAVTNKSITITSGAASGYVEFTLTPTPDMLKEEIETISVEGTLTGVTFSQTAIKLTDSDAAPAVTITLDADTGENGIQNSIDESDTSGKTVRVTATLEGTTRFPGSKAVTITVGKAGDTATEGTDYATVADQTITIPANTASASVDFTLTPRQDMLDDDNESISVEGSATGVGTVTHASITITDDDSAPTSMTITVDADTAVNNDQDSLVEDGGAKTVRVTATLGGSSRFPTNKTVTIVVGKAADSATEGTDYATVTNKSITITSGAASGYVDFTLTPTPDTLVEGEESISIEGSLAGITSVTNTAIKLTDSDAAPAVTITLDADTGENGIQNSIDESDTSGKTVRVTATLEGTTRFPGSKAVTITVGKAGDTATEGTDYATVADQTITIPANTASASVDFTLTPRQDMLDDDNESISVEGSATGVGTVTHASITITDDDSAPTSMTITVDADTAVNNDQDSLVEDGGAKTVRVTATLGGSSRFPTNKTVTIVVGKAADSATEGTDYATVTNKSITITSGAASGYVDFTLTPTPDTLVEGEESISIEGSLAGITSVTNTAIKLTDSDAAPAVTITLDADTGENGIQNSIDESDTSGKTVRVTATLEGTTRFPGSKAVTITVGKAGDTATEGTDYATVADQTITIPANTASASVDFTLTPRQDMLDDDNESISVEGSATGVGTVTHASITITDDDSAPTSMTITVDADTAVNNDQDSLVEDGGAKTVRVTATLEGTTRFPTDKTVTISVGKAADSATEGTDYATVADKTITITAGTASGYVDFTLTPTDDTVDEQNETISVEGTLQGVTAINTKITITDDDDSAPTAMTITVDADTGTNNVQNSIAEDGGAKTVRVTATLVGSGRFPTNKAVTITVGKAADSATEGTDYENVADQTITINAGAASGTVDFTLTPKQDTLAEGEERISVEGTLTGITSVTNTQITITDDDAAPTAMTITVDADTSKAAVQDSIVEDGGKKTVRVTAAITSGATRFATDKTVTISVGKAADSATSGTDYTAVTDKTITITAGKASGYVEFDVTPTPDTLAEGEESISVEGTLQGVTATNTKIKLTDSDIAPAMEITVDADTGTEAVQNSIDESDTSGKTVRVTATLEGTTRFPADKTVTISVGKAADSATSGTDYEAVTDKTITITAGAASGTVDFTLTPDDDVLAEGSESISVEGTAPGITSVTNTQITITDDDAAPTAMTITVDADTSKAAVQDSIVEDGGVKTVRVTAAITGATRFATDKTVTISVGKAGDSATEGTDYAEVTDKTITINAGAASGTVDFTLTPIDDTVDEQNETISVEGTLQGVTATNTKITLTDDDVTPELSITPPSVIETDSPNSATLTFTVTMNVASGQQVSVSYADTETGTATAGKDYVPFTPDILTFSPGETTETFSIKVRGDTVDEYDETIVVRLSSLANARFPDGAETLYITAIIQDDDDPPVLSIDSPSVTEGGTPGISATMTFTATIFPESGKTVTVSYADTETGTATSGKDYLPLSPGTMTFAPGETRKTVAVTVTGDEVDEYDETIVLRLSNPVDATFPDNAASLNSTGTIIDNNEPPELSLANADPVEEGSVAKFPLLLSGATEKTIKVRWTTSSGTAVENIDYHGRSEIITIAPGTTTEAIEVVTIDDREIEELTEIFSVELSDPVDLTLENAEAEGTIMDNDRPASIKRLKRVNKAILPYVGSALVRSRIDQVTGCIGHAAAGTVYGDLPSLERQLRNNARNWEQDPMERVSLSDVFDDVRFAAMFNAYGEEHSSGDVTFCAGSDWNELSGAEEGPVTWDGSLMGTHLGGNVRVSEGMLTGLDMFLYRGSFDWTDVGGEEKFDGDWRLGIRGVSPYVALLSEDGEAQLWTMAGYGFGDVTIEEEILNQSADITMKSVAIGGVMPLRRISNISLDLRGDLWLAEFEISDNGDLIESVSVQTRGVRALLESTWQSTSFTPSLRVGVKHDNSSADSTGMEIGSGIEWRAGPKDIRMSFRSRALIVPGRFQEWGIGADVLLAPSDGLGPSLRATTSRGDSRENAAALLENSSQTEFGDSETAEISVEAEAGWGIRALSGRGVMTPFAGISLLGRDENVLRLGGRVNSGRTFNLELEGRRENGNTDGAVYELLLQLKFSRSGS